MRRRSGGVQRNGTSASDGGKTTLRRRWRVQLILIPPTAWCEFLVHLRLVILMLLPIVPTVFLLNLVLPARVFLGNRWRLSDSRS